MTQRHFLRTLVFMAILLVWPITALAIDRDIDFSGVTRFFDRHSAELTVAAIVAAILLFLSTRNALGCLGVGFTVFVFCFSFIFLGWLTPILFLLIPVVIGRFPSISIGSRAVTYSSSSDVYVAPPVIHHHDVRPVIVQPVIRHVVVQPYETDTTSSVGRSRQGRNEGQLSTRDDQ